MHFTGTTTIISVVYPSRWWYGGATILQYMCCEVVRRVDMCDDVCYVVSQKVEGVRVGMKAKQASKGGERWHSW